MVEGFIKSNIIARRDRSEVKGDPAPLRSALSDRFTSFPSRKVRQAQDDARSVVCANITHKKGYEQTLVPLIILILLTFSFAYFSFKKEK